MYKIHPAKNSNKRKVHSLFALFGKHNPTVTNSDWCIKHIDFHIYECRCM